MLKRLTKKRRKIIKEMYKKGYTIQQIMTKFNLQVGTIWYVIKKVAQIKREKQLKNFEEQLNRLTDFDIGYLVGIIEGEGSLIIHKEGKRIRAGLSISNCDLKIIKFLSKKIPFFTHKNRIHKFKKYLKHSRRKEWSNIYEYKTNDKKILKILLTKIKPYMVGKKKEVELMIKFLNSKDEKEQNYIRKMIITEKAKKSKKVKPFVD